MLKSLSWRWLPALVLIVGLSATASIAAPNPSFPCSKRMSPDEKAICQDPRLTALDHIANQGYMFLRAKLGKAEANRLNLPLIRQRQKCKADVVCIEKAQRESIRIFNQNGARLTIPDFGGEEAVKSEQNVAENPPAAVPESSPNETPGAAEPVQAPNPPPQASASEPAPAVKPTEAEEAAAPADKASAPTGESETTAAPESPPAAAAEAENKQPQSAGEAAEPVDRPPVESEEKTAANDNSAPREDSGSAAGATENEKGSREWRPEIEKELRAESELESTATEMLTKEMAEAEQIRPLTREQRQSLESSRSKHRTAFMLAAILFALVVAYAISKLRRDPGMVAAPARRATLPDAAETVKTSLTTPASPLSPRPAASLQPVNDPKPAPTASARPIIETAPAQAPSSASPQTPPTAWVWTHYKGRI